MNPDHFKKYLKRVWIWTVILSVILCLWPIEYRITRITLIAGVLMIWGGALVLWWQRRSIRVAIILFGIVPLTAVCLPGRAVDLDGLAIDYIRVMRTYKGVRYVWGGEGWLGIDCSGLVRKGLVWGQLYLGLRTCNGRPIRDALSLWWHDCSAMALRDGYRGWTSELFRKDRVADANPALLRPGDLAVTADGVHVMAYLGSSTWIEADPDAHKVMEVVVPTDNNWFNTPVVFVRWRCLAK